MQQQLEVLAYELPKIQKKSYRTYDAEDLESLSATALYYGTGGGSGSGSGSSGGFGGGFFSGFGGKAPSGGGPKPSISGSTIFKTPYMDACERGPSGGGSKPASIGTFSGFKPASDLGLGPGIVKEAEEFLERYRAGKHEKFGEDHVNLEYLVPGKKTKSGKQKWIDLANIHIPLDNE